MTYIKKRNTKFFLFGILLLLAFFMIAFLASLGCHLYLNEYYVASAIVWISCCVTTYYWINALFYFVEQHNKNKNY